MANSLRVQRVVAPLRQQVKDLLKNAILHGRFLPGDRLGEKELCELTGVSRTSVREAIRLLEAEGFVTNLPVKGPVVATIDAAEAKGLYEVRAVLEGLAARNFAREASDTQRAELRRTLETLEHGVSRDVQEQHHAITAFYEVLLSGAANDTLTSTLKLLHERSTRLRLTSIKSSGRIEHTLTELQEIVTAIDARDEERAWRSSVEHVRKAGEAALKMITSMQANREAGAP
ncbi:MAG: GntR family transcriptional regulator [Burkholderiales bacterium]